MSNTPLIFYAGAWLEIQTLHETDSNGHLKKLFYYYLTSKKFELIFYLNSMALSLNIPWSERLIWLASAALNELAALAHFTGAVQPPPFDTTDVSKWMTLEPRVSKGKYCLEREFSNSALKSASRARG